MTKNNPNKDWLFNEKNDEKPSVEKEKKIKHEKYRKKKPKRTFSSKIKYKSKGLKYKLFKKRYRRISFSPGLFVSLFVPLLVGVIVLYLLEPGMSLMLQYGSSGYGIELILFLGWEYCAD